MAGVRFELLVGLAWTLLLVSVEGWERINEAQLLQFYENGQWGEPQSVTSTDDRSDYDDDEDAVPEDELPQVEGAATTEGFDSFDNHDFQVDSADSGPRNEADSDDGGFQVEYVDTPPSNWDSGTDGDFQMEFVDAPPRSWTSGSSLSSPGLDVVCSEVGFQITLPTGPLSEVKVLGSKDMQSLMDVPQSCGYEVNSLRHTLSVPFIGCNVKHVGSCNADRYSLQLLYVDEFGGTQIATAICEKSPKFPRSSGQPSSKCSPLPPSPPSKAQNCGVATGERVSCGHSGISSSACELMGCCVDSLTSACYYPMDECTGDQHFVFAIRSNSATISVDPTKLVIAGSPNCKPVIVNTQVAIFKFKVTECGARAYEVGETKIYLAEVQTVVKALKLKYGVVTRSDPLRFMVECRYSKTGSAQQSLASVGYMVKTPRSILPSAVISNGLYGVQLKIATDKTYSSFLPTNNQPLRLLLGKPVYLELRLKSPKPDAVIIVNYCIAYPRSAKNALVLIYEGCANPFDPNVAILKVNDLPKNRFQRRFMVKAFQFMDQITNKYLNEEIYFMCSAEVCRPAEKTCEQRCFDGKAP